MFKKGKSSAALAALASLASSALLAQAPPTLVIAFDGSQVQAVPLDLWTSVGAALAIAAGAFAFFRHRRPGSFGRLSAWLVMSTAAAGAVLMASRVDFIAVANAILPVLTLTTSPASIVIGNGNATVEVDNGTNQPIRIDSVRLQNPSEGQQIVQFEGTNCVPGFILQVRSTCFVAIERPD